jgi:pimeloyl-ACP methyl ester carboxylesterase
LGETTGQPDEADGFVHGLFGKEVSEEELATFLRLAGFAVTEDDPRSHPNWPRWVQHRATLSWLSPLLDHPERSIDDLGRIAAPTLLTKGTQSTAVDRRLVDVLGERLPDGQVREFQGDHAHHIEEMDAFLDAVEAHLGRRR